MADEKTTYDLLAVTGCPTGIAHTYMAKEALEKAAAAKGLTIKVETQGQVGAENEVTPAEIKACKAVIIAADKDVQPERFEGKPLVSVGVTAAIKDPEGLIDKALAAKAEGELTAEVANASADEVVEKESVGHQIYRHLMNGVSHMLVFVVAGGVLTALS
ncbi:fructose PTS transporter subunit IIB, partial [Thermophilibacter sp.]|uniref:PTS fructose transporter subunit IIB n=1 Tax=Thermophilibacter sp. TaxID=2847309 RepID=UPI003A8F5007